MAHILNHIRHSKSDFIEAENTVVAIRERLAKQAHKPHQIGGDGSALWHSKMNLLNNHLLSISRQPKERMLPA